MKKSIDQSELLKRGAIYFERIEEGFETYEVDYMEGTEEELYQALLSLYHINGESDSFVDFYFFRLSEPEKVAVLESLTVEEKNYLLALEDSNDSVFYPLDDMLLAITAKLSARELLFSTFYFSKEPVTVWGNYQHRYPVFRNKNVSI